MTHTQFQHHTALLAAIVLSFGILLAATLFQAPGCLTAGNVYAAEENFGNQNLQGLVPCGNHIAIVTDDPKEICYVYECTVCDLQNMAMRIMTFFVVFVVAVAALMFANAGVLYTLSPSNPGNIGRAHRIFMNTLIGLILVLAAWLIVNTIMKYAYGEGPQNWGPWNTMLCKNYQGMQCFDKPKALELKGSDFLPYLGGTNTGRTSATGENAIQNWYKDCINSAGGDTTKIEACGKSVDMVFNSSNGTYYSCIDEAANKGNIINYTYGNIDASIKDTCYKSALATLSGATAKRDACIEFVQEGYGDYTMDKCNSIYTADYDAAVLKYTSSGATQWGTITSCASGGTNCISSTDAVNQLKAAGIEVQSGPDGLSYGPTLPQVNQQVIDAAKVWNSMCDCIEANSLTGGHDAGGHILGEKIDINDNAATVNWFSNTSVWEPIQPRGTDLQYYNAQTNTVCARESTHYDCCVGSGKTTCS